MIDFRYHLVSIVSIFLALAVGIALGAGPLKGQLGDTITGEITSLRQDKATLNSELDAAAKDADKRDAFIASGNKLLLAGRLAGATVDIVVLPNADSAVVKTTSATLIAAGAKLGATVQVKAAWTDATTAAQRKTIGDEQLLALGLDAQTDAQFASLDRVLATALQPGDGQLVEATAALMALSDAKLISFSPKEPIAATSVVVLGAPVTGGTAAEQTATAQEYAALSTTMDRVAKGAVLASNVGAVATTDEQSVVGTARGNDGLYRGLSTVDDVGIPMGQASIVLALLEQFAGGSGHYGLASDATAAFPVLQGS